MMLKTIFRALKWRINGEIHSYISGDWKQTYKSMNDDDDWVICSNRQDVELDADIRSVKKLLSHLIANGLVVSTWKPIKWCMSKYLEW